MNDTRTHFKVLKKASAVATLAAFILTNHFNGPLYAAAAVPVSSEQIENNFRDIRETALPESIGKVQETFQGIGNRAVILVQDAHAIPSAQRNIEKIIGHYQKNYGVRHIGLEGSHAQLDPKIFKSFPDKRLLRKIFEEYYEHGELTGGAAAAIFSDYPSVYYGIENWDLYELGVGLYLASMQEEPVLQKKTAAWHEDLEKRKKEIYPDALYALDKQLADFREKDGSILEVLKSLAAIRPPAKNSEIAALLQEVENEKKENASIVLEVKALAKEIEKHLKKSASSKESKNKMRQFRAKQQDFLTSRISPEAFALFMKELAEKDSLPVKVSPKLLGGMKNQKTVHEIEGTRFFNQLEEYIQAVRQSLAVSEAQKKIEAENKLFGWVSRLIKLELTREEWQEYKEGKLDFKTQSFISPADLDLNFAFYRNAEDRDRVFLERLFDGMKQKKSKGLQTGLLVAGGFHAHGMMQRLREKSISYVLVMPQIGEVPEDTNYRSQMRGEMSWKNYFKVENGKVNMYQAFVRSARDKLLSAEKESAGEVSKQWRDQIIRDLADERKVAEAGQYTRFIDETADLSAAEKNYNEALDKIHRFIDELRLLESKKEITQENVFKLMRPSAVAQFGPPQAASPGDWDSLPDAARDRARIAVRKPKAAAVRSEVRQLTETPFEGEVLKLYSEGVAAFQGGYDAEGDEALKVSLFQSAAELFRQAIRKESNPANQAKLWLRVGDALYNINQRDPELIQINQNAIQANPGNILARQNLATAYWRIGLLKEAENTFREALKIAPNSEDIRDRLEGLLEEIKLRESLAANPLDGQAWSDLGDLIYSKDEPDRDLQLILINRNAIAGNPSEAKYWFNLGQAYFRLGLYDESLEFYEQVIRLANSSQAELKQIARENSAAIKREYGEKVFDGSAFVNNQVPRNVLGLLQQAKGMVWISGPASLQAALNDVSAGNLYAEVKKQANHYYETLGIKAEDKDLLLTFRLLPVTDPLRRIGKQNVLDVEFKLKESAKLRLLKDIQANTGLSGKNIFMPHLKLSASGPSLNFSLRSPANKISQIAHEAAREPHLTTVFIKREDGLDWALTLDPVKKTILFVQGEKNWTVDAKKNPAIFNILQYHILDAAESNSIMKTARSEVRVVWEQAEFGIKLVLEENITNAVQAAVNQAAKQANPDARVKVELRETTYQDKPYIAINITDNGPGFNPVQLRETAREYLAAYNGFSNKSDVEEMGEEWVEAVKRLAETAAPSNRDIALFRLLKPPTVFFTTKKPDNLEAFKANGGKVITDPDGKFNPYYVSARSGIDEPSGRGGVLTEYYVRELMKGEVEVINKPGEGFQTRLLLPRDVIINEDKNHLSDLAGLIKEAIRSSETWKKTADIEIPLGIDFQAPDFISEIPALSATPRSEVRTSEDVAATQDLMAKVLSGKLEGLLPVEASGLLEAIETAAFWADELRGRPGDGRLELEVLERAKEIARNYGPEPEDNLKKLERLQQVLELEDLSQIARSEVRVELKDLEDARKSLLDAIQERIKFSPDEILTNAENALISMGINFAFDYPGPFVSSALKHTAPLEVLAANPNYKFADDIREFFKVYHDYLTRQNLNGIEMRNEAVNRLLVLSRQVQPAISLVNDYPSAVQIVVPGDNSSETVKINIDKTGLFVKVTKAFPQGADYVFETVELFKRGVPLGIGVNYERNRIENAGPNETYVSDQDYSFTDPKRLPPKMQSPETAMNEFGYKLRDVVKRLDQVILLSKDDTRLANRNSTVLSMREFSDALNSMLPERYRRSEVRDNLGLTNILLTAAPLVSQIPFGKVLNFEDIQSSVNEPQLRALADQLDKVHQAAFGISANEQMGATDYWYIALRNFNPQAQGLYLFIDKDGQVRGYRSVDFMPDGSVIFNRVATNKNQDNISGRGLLLMDGLFKVLEERKTENFSIQATNPNAVRFIERYLHSVGLSNFTKTVSGESGAFYEGAMQGYTPRRSEVRMAFGQDINDLIVGYLAILARLKTKKEVLIVPALDEISDYLKLVDVKKDQESGVYKFNALNRFGALSKIAALLIDWPMEWYGAELTAIESLDLLPERYRAQIPRVQTLLADIAAKINSMKEEIAKEQEQFRPKHDYPQLLEGSRIKINDALTNLARIRRSEMRPPQGDSAFDELFNPIGEKRSEQRTGAYVPELWDEFTHFTNRGEWYADEGRGEPLPGNPYENNQPNMITTTGAAFGNGLSVAPREDYERAMQSPKYVGVRTEESVAKIYANRGVPADRNQSFEIKVILLKSPYYGDMRDKLKKMYPAEIENKKFSDGRGRALNLIEYLEWMHGQIDGRHPVVPGQTRMIQVGRGVNKFGRDIFYYVPEPFYNYYKAAVGAEGQSIAGLPSFPARSEMRREIKKKDLEGFDKGLVGMVKELQRSSDFGGLKNEVHFWNKKKTKLDVEFMRKDNVVQFRMRRDKSGYYEVEAYTYSDDSWKGYDNYFGVSGKNPEKVIRKVMDKMRKEQPVRKALRLDKPMKRSETRRNLRSSQDRKTLIQYVENFQLARSETRTLAALLQRGFEHTVGGEKLYLKSSSPVGEHIENYLKALELRTSKGYSVVPPIRHIFVSLTYLNVEASMAARKVILSDKGPDRIDMRTVPLLEEALRANPGLFQLHIVKAEKEYRDAAAVLNLNPDEFFQAMIASGSLMIASEWKGESVPAVMAQNPENRELHKKLGAAAGEALALMHNSNLIAGDQHAKQYVVRFHGDDIEVNRVDLVDIQTPSFLLASSYKANELGWLLSDAAVINSPEFIGGFREAYLKFTARSEMRGDAYGDDITSAVNQFVAIQILLNTYDENKITGALSAIAQFVENMMAKKDEESGEYKYISFNRYSGIARAATLLVQWPVMWYGKDFENLPSTNQLPQKFRKKLPQIQSLIEDIRAKMAGMKTELQRDQERLKPEGEDFPAYLERALDRIDGVLNNLRKINRSEMRVDAARSPKPETKVPEINFSNILDSIVAGNFTAAAAEEIVAFISAQNANGKDGIAALETALIAALEARRAERIARGEPQSVDGAKFNAAISALFSTLKPDAGTANAQTYAVGFVFSDKPQPGSNKRILEALENDPLADTVVTAGKVGTDFLTGLRKMKKMMRPVNKLNRINLAGQNRLAASILDPNFAGKVDDMILPFSIEMNDVKDPLVGDFATVVQIVAMIHTARILSEKPAIDAEALKGELIQRLGKVAGLNQVITADGRFGKFGFSISAMAAQKFLAEFKAGKAVEAAA